ncbi:hypothetical protein BCON_0133g00360 [Botryotinia convoluta]|uniref:Uncharacterized protein n=1 Tax=Botryotinia convoluta TaxID=54673 RepID=A0A4Z1HVA2_9HELO|nr:hypothetical protein BCON_0133g00360 [Botryotinia convoluta]
MNTSNNVTSGHYCEIDRFRCLKCEHDDYRHRYRCERHLVGDAYCREAIPMITPDRNVFCRDCAEDDDLEASNQGRMSPEMPVTRHVPIGSNITQERTAEIQPVSTNSLQSPGPADPNMSSGGWDEPGGVPLSMLNPQSSAHVTPDQDLAMAPLASQNSPAAPPSSDQSKITTAPALAPAPTAASASVPEPAPGSATRHTGIWEKLRGWCCCSSEESAT